MDRRLAFPLRRLVLVAAPPPTPVPSNAESLLRQLAYFGRLVRYMTNVRGDSRPGSGGGKAHSGCELEKSSLHLDDAFLDDPGEGLPSSY